MKTCSQCGRKSPDTLMKIRQVEGVTIGAKLRQIDLCSNCTPVFDRSQAEIRVKSKKK